MVQQAQRSTGVMKETAGRIFDGLAKSYERTLDLATLLQDRYWKRWLLSRAALTRSDRVLDIGCGTCVLEESLEGTGCGVVGLDLTLEMLRRGKSKKLACAEVLLEGDAEALPFPDDSFDVIVSCYVVKYCDSETFAAEVARALRPGGRLVMYDFARPRGTAFPFLALYTYGMLGLAGRLLEHLDSGVSYTFKELPRIIRNSNWSDSLPSSLVRNGLELVERRPLSGGAVEAFVAQKANGMGRS